jgi:ornithine cyclodeaminase/alanine dehydrogenase-like protein (mu-crystallin family)
MDMAQDRAKLAARLNIGKEIWYMTRDEVVATGLTETDILALTRDALVAHGKKDYEMPAKIGVHPFQEVFFHAMPAYVPGKLALGCKWIECYPGNPEKFGLPQTTGLLLINDVLSGCPLAVMDCAWVTAMRTPAVTVLAAAALHPDAETFGMFGCGVQGVEHVKFAPHTLKKLKKIVVYDTREARMDDLIAQVQPRIPVPIVKGASFEQVTKDCEVLSSATFIVREPFSFVRDAWVAKGQTILPCDLNTFWDPATSMRADKYIVDSAEEHELFAGAGYFPGGLPRITCQTGEVLAGLKPGRERPDELIVCSNIGMSVCDVVVGREVLDRALALGIGRKLPL